MRPPGLLKGDNLVHAPQARRIISMKGRLKNSDCKGAMKKLKIDETSKKAQKLVSDFDTGRIHLCTT